MPAVRGCTGPRPHATPEKGSKRVETEVKSVTGACQRWGGQARVQRRRRRRPVGRRARRALPWQRGRHAWPAWQRQQGGPTPTDGRRRARKMWCVGERTALDGAGGIFGPRTAVYGGVQCFAESVGGPCVHGWRRGEGRGRRGARPAAARGARRRRRQRRRTRARARARRGGPRPRARRQAGGLPDRGLRGQARPRCLFTGGWGIRPGGGGAGWALGLGGRWCWVRVGVLGGVGPCRLARVCVGYGVCKPGARGWG
jgi:hypothetical protein